MREPVPDVGPAIPQESVLAQRVDASLQVLNNVDQLAQLGSLLLHLIVDAWVIQIDHIVIP